VAYENIISAVIQSWAAGADLSAKQYYAVQLNTSDQIVLADATVRTLGILQDAPKSGQAGAVMLSGVGRAITDGSGSAIARMDALASDANGILVKTTTDNDEIVAIALEPSTVANAIIAVFALPLRRY
jgi:hypothetical protein